MNELSTITKHTMSSREIADLVESRHDHVKLSIERLYKAGIIQRPPMEDVKNSQGQTVAVYEINKRDSYVVVAQLSPQFTGRLVDRWQELESKAVTLPDFTNPAIAARAWADEVEAKLIAQEKIKEKDKLIIATNQAQIAAGEILVREFVKGNDLIELGEKGFYSWMREQGIVSVANEPFQQYVKQGYFTFKPSEEMHGGKFRYTLRITPRGKVWLAKKYLVYLDEQ